MVDRPIKKADRAAKVEMPEAMSSAEPSESETLTSETQSEALEVIHHNETPESEVQGEALEVIPNDETPSEILNSEILDSENSEAIPEIEQAAVQKSGSTSENPRKAPPIKLKDRSEKSLEPSSGSDGEKTSEKTVVRSPKKVLDKGSDRNAEGKGDGQFGDRAPGFNPNAKVIDAKEKAGERNNGRGSDRDDRGGNRRNSRNEEPRQVASLAFVRGPKPTKPKAEEPPAELEIEAESSTEHSSENSSESSAED
jgi:hypothetical protein